MAFNGYHIIFKRTGRVTFGNKQYNRKIFLAKSIILRLMKRITAIWKNENSPKWGCRVVCSRVYYFIR